MNNSIPTTGSQILVTLGTRISTIGTKRTEIKILGIRTQGIKTQGIKIIDFRTAGIRSRDSRTLGHKVQGSLTNFLGPLPEVQTTTASTIERIDSIVPTTRTISLKHPQDVRMSMREDRIPFRTRIPTTSNHRCLHHHLLPSHHLSLHQIMDPFLFHRFPFMAKFQLLGYVSFRKRSLRNVIE